MEGHAHPIHLRLTDCPSPPTPITWHNPEPTVMACRALRTQRYLPPLPDRAAFSAMLVQKRDGRREHVAFDKITARIKKLCYGFDPKHVDPVIVAQKVVGGVYDGVTTKQLDDLASETAAFLTTQHPDYGRLAARIAVSNLHKQTEKSFSETM